MELLGQRHGFWEHGVSIAVPTAVIRCPEKNKLRERGFVLTHITDRGGEGGDSCRDLRQVVRLCSHSGSRAPWVLALSSCSPSQTGIAPPTLKMDLSI